MFGVTFTKIFLYLVVMTRSLTLNLGALGLLLISVKAE